MNQIYTLGYYSWTPAALRDAVQSRNAVLWDIRYSPESRHPWWQRQALAALLGTEG